MSKSKEKIKKQISSSFSKDKSIFEDSFFFYNPEAALIIDKNGKVLSVNHQFSQLFNYRPADLINKKITTILLFTEDNNKHYAEYLKNPKAEIRTLEAILTKKDHSRVEIEISGYPLFSPEKGYQGNFITLKDISQRKLNQRLHRAFFNISRIANTNISLAELYDIIYSELNRVLFAVNFHIALWDKEKNRLTFPYFVDEKNEPEKENEQSFLEGLASYTIKYGKPLLVNYEKILRLAEAGHIKLIETKKLTENTSWLGVPLKIGIHLLGCMSVANYSMPDAYTENDINSLEFISELIAAAIERKIAEKEIHQNQERFASFFISNPLASVYLDKEDTVLDINPRFTELFGYNRKDVIGKKLGAANFYPPGKKEEGEELTRKTFYSTFVRFETIRKAKDGRLIPVQISSSQIKIKDQTSGVIGLYEDITEQKQNEELQQVLYNISEAASSSMSLAQLYKNIHIELKKVINTNNFYIALLNEEKDKISFVYYSDELDENSTPIDVSLKNTLTGYLLKGQQSLLLNYSQMQLLVLESKIDIYGPISKNICWLGVPLKMEGKVFGVIVVQDYNNPVAYSSKDIKLMEIVAVQAATAITRKQSEEKIIYISFHDTLTGLYNRAYFEEELKRMNHPRFYPLSLVMADVSGLKAVNDAFGHHQGDQLLKNLANILKRNSREVDVLARLGGDEFAIVLPDTSSAAAETYCQRIVNDCQQNNFEPLYLNPNISMGFATQEGNFSDYEAIFREADKKMYQNKLLNVKSKEKYLLDAFLSILLERDIHTEKHAQRLVNIATKIGQKIGLSPYDLDKLRLLALLHDIGKIGVPESILFKVEPLTDEEWRILKNHTNIGYRITKNIPDFSSIANEILYHHERWDGKGYPSGLKGKDIPLLSRIISIVDTFDAMQATRPYKKPLTRKQALAEIRRNTGTQFDPELVNIFFEVINQKLLK